MHSSRLRLLVIVSALLVLAAGIVIFSPNLLSFIFGKPHPGSCLILEEKYCKTVTFIPYTLYSPGYKGEKLAAYRLPVGATIFAPAAADLSPVTVPLRHNASENTLSQGGFILNESSSQHSQETNHIFTFMFNKAPYISLHVKKGAAIGTITSDTPISFFGDYNFVVVLSQQTAYLLKQQQGQFPNHNTPSQAIITDASKELEQLLQPHKQ